MYIVIIMILDKKPSCH